MTLDEFRETVRAMKADADKRLRLHGLTLGADPAFIESLVAALGEITFDEAIAADNSCLEGVQRQGLIVAMHICRGNNESKWYAEGGYEPIAEKLFSSLAVDRFLLEYDTARAGTFEPLRFMPRDKMVVLGLVSSKEPKIESQDELRRRIDEASRYVPIENLALSPQCGFSSTVDGNDIGVEQQRAKLALCVELAHEVWGGL